MQGRAGAEDSGNPQFENGRDIVLRDGASGDDQSVIAVHATEGFHDGGKSVMWAPERNGEADDIDIFLQRRVAIISGVWKSPV
jgi:hypothetical protein